MTRRALSLGIAFVLASAAGCASEKVSPVPTASATSTTPTPPDQPPLGPPPKRTVIQRNPFGDVAITNNLLWDGDFEWSSPFADQYGWFEGQSPVLEEVVVGPACRSGMKCARVGKSKYILGLAVSSSEFDLEAWVYVRFEDGGAGTPCTKAQVNLIPDGFHDEPLEHFSVSATPDATGWCKFQLASPKHQDKVYLQVKNVSGSPMLVDDAVIRPAGIIAADGGSVTVPTPEESKDAAEVRASIRLHEEPHDAPPNQAKRAFQAWAGKGRTAP
jgi:hypothetical protein